MKLTVVINCGHTCVDISDFYCKRIFDFVRKLVVLGMVHEPFSNLIVWIIIYYNFCGVANFLFSQHFLNDLLIELSTVCFRNLDMQLVVFWSSAINCKVRYAEIVWWNNDGMILIACEAVCLDLLVFWLLAYVNFIFAFWSLCQKVCYS